MPLRVRERQGRARRRVGAADPRRHDRTRGARGHGRRGDGVLPPREDVRAPARRSSACSMPDACPPRQIEARVAEWAAVRIDRAGEVFRVDGVAIVEAPGSPGYRARPPRGRPPRTRPARGDPRGDAGRRGGGSRADQGPSPAPGAARRRGSRAVRCARGAGSACRSSSRARTSSSWPRRPTDAAAAGVTEILLEPPGADLPTLHQNLTAHPSRRARPRPPRARRIRSSCASGPASSRRPCSASTKFASVLALADAGGETWLPLWTLRQNIYTDPQKPLQMDPGVYPIGEPDAVIAAAGDDQLLADLLHRLDRARRHRRAVPSGGRRCRGT